MTGRSVTIIGSGETAPTMVKVHRGLFDRTGPGPAVLLDTPYGFQVNAPEISRRTRDYFAASVGRRVELVSWRRDPGAGLARERALAALRAAAWLFCGPGSPTYALRQWLGTPLPAVLRERVEAGTTMVFASAAAATLGAFTVPVYEVYKAGADPHWRPGLDLLEPLTGLPAVVVPHFDNAEGGHYDTRYCYLGEERLRVMEGQLPGGVFVLGVDEHTAVRLDLDARTATVLGHGALTVRREGRSARFPAPSTVGFADLADLADPADSADSAGSAGSPASAGPAGADRCGAAACAPRNQPSLRASADACRAAFDTALSERDTDGCVSAVLELEQALEDWVADTDVSDERAHSRSLLRAMAVDLGELAREGAADPRARLAPYVDALLEQRSAARAAGDFARADAIRARLVGAGVEVRDTPDGPQWRLR